MGTPIQVVFDATDPERLARFWAAALHYEMQAPPAGYASWEAFLEAMHVPPADRNAASAIVDPEGKGPRLYFQQMDTPKPTKNRLHLDVNVGGGGKVPLEERKAKVDAEVTRLVRLGATRLVPWEEQLLGLPPWEAQGEYWVVMADPEGNEFCVQ